MLDLILRKWFKFTKKEIKDIKKHFYEEISKTNIRNEP